MKKQRQRRVYWLAQGHTTSQYLREDLHTGLPHLRSSALYTLFYFDLLSDAFSVRSVWLQTISYLELMSPAPSIVLGTCSVVPDCSWLHSGIFWQRYWSSLLFPSAAHFTDEETGANRFKWLLQGHRASTCLRADLNSWRWIFLFPGAVLYPLHYLVRRHLINIDW